MQELLEWMEYIEDTRQQTKVRHTLKDILVIVLFATLANADKKLLEEYKSEINELKALKMPREDMKDGSSIRGEAQEEIERLKAQLKLSEEERNKAKEKEPVKTESKKWWHFGRM